MQKLIPYQFLWCDCILVILQGCGNTCHSEINLSSCVNYSNIEIWKYISRWFTVLETSLELESWSVIDFLWQEWKEWDWGLWKWVMFQLMFLFYKEFRFQFIWKETYSSCLLHNVFKYIPRIILGLFHKFYSRALNI